MGKLVTKQVTIDPEAWARNLRVAPDAPPDDDALKRWLNNYFAFWVICPAKACTRTKRCAGDPKACHDRFMPLVPERIKFEFRATLKAIDEGLSLEGVMRKVKEEMARFDEITRGLESIGAHPPQERSRGRASLPQAGEGKASGGPRVRTL